MADWSSPNPIFLLMFAIASVLARSFYRTVLTARGVEVWWFRGRLIPWSQITGVVVDGRAWNQRVIRLRRPPDQPWVRLAAPTAPWGIGSGHLHRARDLIEEMWVRHRDDAAPEAVAPEGLWSPPPA